MQYCNYSIISLFCLQATKVMNSGFPFLYLLLTQTQNNMKKIIVFVASAITISCNNGTATSEQKDSSAKTTNVSYAYPIDYSANFEIADPKLAQKVTELWKDFDNNNLDNQKTRSLILL